MPIFTIPGLSADLLASKGARLRVEIGVPSAIQAVLSAQGKPIPPAISGLGILDTGASGFGGVTQAIPISLGLPVTGQVSVETANGHVMQDVYVISARFLDLKLPAQDVVTTAADLPKDIDFLIGREFMRGWSIGYDGTTGIVTIRY